jgi:peptidoglycan L-alanyl-D-glutamate endopeptidase CwlK
MIHKDFRQVRGDLANKVAKLQMVMALLGHPLIIVETYRTQQRQDDLYAKGRTVPGPRVTWTRNSRHTEGRAVDVAFKGPEPYSEAHPWELLQTVATKLGLEGLGARDRVHWQV